MPPRRRRCQARAAHPGTRRSASGPPARTGPHPPACAPAAAQASGSARRPRAAAASCSRLLALHVRGRASPVWANGPRQPRASQRRMPAWRVWSAYVTTGRPSGGRPLTTCFALCGKCRREISWWVHRPRELRRAPCAGVEPAPRKQGPGRVLRAHQSPAACSSSAAEEPPARSVFKGGSCSPIAPRGDRVQVRGAARAPPRLCQRLRATAADGRSAVEDHRTPRTPPGLRRCRRVRG